MKITSMLSDGYLQPFHKALRGVEHERTSTTPLSAQEQHILAQERALKAAYGVNADVSTTYRYSIAPDGRRYITGASVSIRGENTPPNSATSDAASPSKAPISDDIREKPGLDEEPEKSKEGILDKSDMEKQAAVRELKRIEQEVIAHEAAHQAAGGALAGAVRYTYTQGPDGRSYITGGEVSIHVPVSDDPEQTLRDMAQVKKAALAPNNPSAQDLKVAAKAAALASSARMELAARNRESANEEQNAEFSPGISSVKAGLLFERLHGESQAIERHEMSIAGNLPDNTTPDLMEAYDRNASSRGLWTLSHGFEPMPRALIPEPNINIAA